MILNKAAIHIAVEKENIEIVKLLLQDKNIDINLLCVSYNNSVMKSQNIYFYEILSYCF